MPAAILGKPLSCRWRHFFQRLKTQLNDATRSRPTTRLVCEGCEEQTNNTIGLRSCEEQTNNTIGLQGCQLPLKQRQRQLRTRLLKVLGCQQRSSKSCFLVGGDTYSNDEMTTTKTTKNTTIEGSRLPAAILEKLLSCRWRHLFQRQMTTTQLFLNRRLALQWARKFPREYEAQQGCESCDDEGQLGRFCLRRG